MRTNNGPVEFVDDRIPVGMRDPLAEGESLQFAVLAYLKRYASSAVILENRHKIHDFVEFIDSVAKNPGRHWEG